MEDIHVYAHNIGITDICIFPGVVFSSNALLNSQSFLNFIFSLYYTLVSQESHIHSPLYYKITDHLSS